MATKRISLSHLMVVVDTNRGSSKCRDSKTPLITRDGSTVALGEVIRSHHFKVFSAVDN